MVTDLVASTSIIFNNVALLKIIEVLRPEAPKQAEKLHSDDLLANQK